MPENCTCIKTGSRECPYHKNRCHVCYQEHPGVSCYWHMHSKTIADRRPGRTFKRSDGSLGCDECCNGDRCDDPSHFSRDSCPFCLGGGENATTN